MKVISLFSFLSLSSIAAAQPAIASALVAVAPGDDFPSPPPKLGEPGGQGLEVDAFGAAVGEACR